MQKRHPSGSPFEMQILGANKGGADLVSDAAKSQRCNTFQISLQYERHRQPF